MTLPADRAAWPDDALEEWDERAAIMEHDGELWPDDAEYAAEARVRARWATRDEQARRRAAGRDDEHEGGET